MNELQYLPELLRLKARCAHAMGADLDTAVVPLLLERCPDRPLLCQQTVTVLGLPEPEVEARIISGSLPEGVELAFNVELPAVQVKLRASGKDARKLLDRAEVVVRRSLGEHIVCFGDETLF